MLSHAIMSPWLEPLQTQYTRALRFFFLELLLELVELLVDFPPFELDFASDEPSLDDGLRLRGAYAGSSYSSS